MTPEQKQELAALRAESAASAPPTVKERESGWEDFGEGVVSSGMDTYYGIKGLMTDLTPEEHARMADWKEDASESGFGTLGRITGEIGQLAIPGGAALKVLKGASKLKTLGKTGTAALGAGVDTTLAGLHGAAQLPEYGESRLGNATSSVAMSALGGGIGMGLGKLAKGVNITDEAKVLLDEGVPLTPGQASQGAIPNMLELAMQISPLRAGRDAARSNAQDAWNLSVFNKARPPATAKLKTMGQATNVKLSKSYDAAYNKAWELAGPPDIGKATSLVNYIQKQSARLNDNSKRVLGNAANDIIDLTDNFSPAKLKSLDKSLRKEQATASRAQEFDLLDELVEVRQMLRSTVGEKAQKKLKSIDKKYPDYLALKRAATEGEGLEEAGRFKAQSLLRASKTIGGENKAFAGTSPFLEEARKGARTVGKEDPPFLANVRKAMYSYAPEATPVMDVGGRVMMGRTKGQEKVTGWIDELRKKRLTGGNLGAAIEE